MSFWDTLGAGLNIAAGMDMVNTFDDLGNLANTEAQQIGANAAADTAFTGYGVQTGLGNSTVDAQGNMDLGVGPDAAMQGLSGSLAGMSTGAFGDAMGMAQAGSYNPYAAQAMDYFNRAGTTNWQQQQAQNLLGSAAGANWQQRAATDMANRAGDANWQQTYATNALKGLGGNRQLGSALSAQGNAMRGLGQQQASALGASQQAMQNALGDRAGREQEIYDRAMAMQQPGLDAQRAQQQAREFAQGRGGVRGSQFGGTAEDAATARAQAQAQNQAAFQAMGQAESEMMNQANMASQFGQMGQAAAGLQGNLGMNIGQLGAQNTQLGQAAANQMAQIGAQRAQQSLAGMNTMAGLGSQLSNQRLQAANQFAGIGNALNAQELAAGQAMGSLGAQNAQLAQASGGMLANLGSQMGQLGQGYYGQSFLPMQQQLAAMEIGGQAADRFQTGQMTGANLQAQAGLTGLEAMINANKVGAELAGNLYGSAANAIGGLQSQDGGFFNTLFGL